MNVVDGTTFIFLAIYFRWISIHWLPYEIFGFCNMCIAFFMYIPLPESPNYLYSNRKFDKARNVLKMIAGINRVKDYNSNFLFDTETEAKTSR